MLRRTLLTAAAGAVGVVTGGGAVRASAGTGASCRAGLADLHDAMAARVARGQLVGAVYLVAHRGRRHVGTVGTVALDSAEPMRRATPFRIASLTKPIVAAAAMMLVEDGRLALDEPIDRLLPELADRRVLTRLDAPLDRTVPAARPITVADVLTFRMGHGMIFEPSFQPPYPIVTRGDELRLVLAQPDPRTPLDPDEWTRRFGTLPLMYQPGTRWQYNTAALVLGVLIARAARRPLGDFLHDRLFRPLGMDHTGFTLPRAEAARLPGLYATDPATGRLARQPGSPPREWTRPPAFPSGASGLASTLDDYAAFSRFLLDRGVHHGRRLLSAESVRLLTTNQLTPAQLAEAGPYPLTGRGWGYGMSVSVVPDAISQPGRYGWEGGYGTVWFNDPNRDLTAIALTQTVDFLFNGGADEFQRLAAAACP
ncbi:serine hydrolase domain-containing protein [Actinoplanes oblitus]|uniref:Serine hydrolase domain-containing protein n=1 Tax=Actinoplanes oblitus TaxID=3040509 RepID=A0ABY8W6C1_9ACTN|nr:serine hydrolase domain-containing protein [Actinoplanes oblitus]WIM92510.1 serine hydrolase domain-containing protein [Actinoplanes oblitus]